MNIRKKVSVLFAVLLIISIITPEATAKAVKVKNFSEAVALGIVTKNEYTTEAKGSVVEYSGVEEFVNMALKQKNVSEFEVAKSIQATVYGEKVAESMSNAQVLEALKYGNIMQTTDYIKMSENGTKTYMDAEEIAIEVAREKIQRAISEKIFARTPTLRSGYLEESYTVSRNGYMAITTTIIFLPDNSTANKRYFNLSAVAEWLILPVWRLEDVIALSWDTASYSSNDSYSDNASIIQTGHCVVCNEELEANYFQTKGSTTTTNNPINAINHLNILHNMGTKGMSCDIKFDTSAGMCIHGEGDDSYNGAVMDSMEAGLWATVYVEKDPSETNFPDFSVIAGYSHKKLDIFGYITAQTNGNTASLSFSAQGVIVKDDYIGRIVTMEV